MRTNCSAQPASSPSQGTSSTTRAPTASATRLAALRYSCACTLVTTAGSAALSKGKASGRVSTGMARVRSAIATAPPGSPPPAHATSSTEFAPPKPSGAVSGFAGSVIHSPPSSTSLYSWRPSGTTRVSVQTPPSARIGQAAGSQPLKLPATCTEPRLRPPAS